MNAPERPAHQLLSKLDLIHIDGMEDLGSNLGGRHGAGAESTWDGARHQNVDGSSIPVCWATIELLTLTAILATFLPYCH
jgi:hypothetical protein